MSDPTDTRLVLGPFRDTLKRRLRYSPFVIDARRRGYTVLVGVNTRRRTFTITATLRIAPELSQLGVGAAKAGAA